MKYSFHRLSTIRLVGSIEIVELVIDGERGRIYALLGINAPVSAFFNDLRN